MIRAWEKCYRNTMLVCLPSFGLSLGSEPRIGCKVSIQRETSTWPDVGMINVWSIVIEDTSP